MYVLNGFPGRKFLRWPDVMGTRLQMQTVKILFTDRMPPAAKTRALCKQGALIVTISLAHSVCRVNICNKVKRSILQVTHL